MTTVTTNKSDFDLDLVKQLITAHDLLIDEVGKVIYGQRDVLELMMISLLCRGHSLLNGLPGLGKTLMARTLARALDLEFCRIQFTPDLMPSDITGTEVINEDPDTGKRTREFLKGPVFTNIVLADEINRTPPKTQSALLQAMQELEVSVGRETYKLQPPFMVLATQNPIELEGTYVLPEAQLDRFMFCINVLYPSRLEEVDIVKSTTTTYMPEVSKILTANQVIQLQEMIRGVPIADDVVNYAVRLASETRPEENSKSKLDVVQNYIRYGASPRASQYLVLAAKALALLSERYYVNFEDIRTVAKPVLRHRIVLNFRSRADKIDSDQIIDRLIEQIPEES